jgi:hypothetical protein
MRIALQAAIIDGVPDLGVSAAGGEPASDIAIRVEVVHPQLLLP